MLLCARLQFGGPPLLRERRPGQVRDRTQVGRFDLFHFEQGFQRLLLS